MSQPLPFRQPPGIGHPPKLEPAEIRRAPELAILEAVDASLDSMVAALVAAHPALLHPEPFERASDDAPAPPSLLYAADAIVSMTSALRAAIDRYHCAVSFESAEGNEPG